MVFHARVELRRLYNLTDATMAINAAHNIRDAAHGDLKSHLASLRDEKSHNGLQTFLHSLQEDAKQAAANIEHAVADLEHAVSKAASDAAAATATVVAGATDAAAATAKSVTSSIGGASARNPAKSPVTEGSPLLGTDKVPAQVIQAHVTSGSKHKEASHFGMRAEMLLRFLQHQKQEQKADETTPMKPGAENVVEVRKVLPSPHDHIWATRHLGLLQQLLQVVMLLTCGAFALYATSLAYGIEAAGLGGAWHVYALAPLIMTLFVLLPDLAHQLALLEAFSEPVLPIVDNVISDSHADQVNVDHLRTQLKYRMARSHEACQSGLLDMIDERSSHDASIAANLAAFERDFERTHTALRRWWAAVVDLAKGQAVCFVDRKACFLAGVLTTASVPVSRERLEYLVRWYEAEVATTDTLSVKALFDALGVEMPKPPPVGA